MILIRLAMAAALTATGFSHAYLYVHGYRHIPTIGTAFLVQASVSFALAVLILIGGPLWLHTMKPSKELPCPIPLFLLLSNNCPRPWPMRCRPLHAIGCRRPPLALGQRGNGRRR